MNSRYLENLSDLDLSILARGSGLLDPHGAADRFRSDPTLVHQALNQPGILQAVFPNGAFAADSFTTESPRPFTGPQQPASVDIDGLRVEPSSFLYFSLVINSAANDMVSDSLRTDLIGDRRFRKFPTADEAAEPQAIAVDHDLRHSIVELLDSFTVARSTRSWNALLPDDAIRPVDERKPLDLIRLLDHVEGGARVGIYRRLGDLSLFLTAFGDAADRGLSSGSRFGADGVHEIVAALPPVLHRKPVRNELHDLLAPMPLRQLHHELGPIWYRMAAHELGQPAIARNLVSLADFFDDAHAFIRRLIDRGRLAQMPSPFVTDTDPRAFR